MKYEAKLKSIYEKRKILMKNIWRLKQNLTLKKLQQIFKMFKNNSIKPATEGSKCICLSAIVIDSIFKSGKNYHSQTFLEEIKHKIKVKEMKEDHLESSFSDDSEEQGYSE